MASKALILLGLFAFLLVVSEMAAAAGAVKSETEETVQPDGYGGGIGGGGGGGGSGRRFYCRHGCCYKGYRGRCSRCCAYAGEAVHTQPGH